MLHTDYLTGGQFFAALRLVLHAVSGKGVDRTLAFVQGMLKLIFAKTHLVFLTMHGSLSKLGRSA